MVLPQALVLLVTLAAADPPAPSTEAAPSTNAAEARAGFKRGKELYNKGDFDSAAEEWEQAYQKQPYPELLYNIGRAYEQAGNLSASIAFYERYLEAKPTANDRPNVEATIKRLRALNVKATREIRQEALDQYRRGVELYQAGRYKEALTLMQEAYKKVPSGTLIYNIARCRERLNDLEGAIKDYKTYLAQEPNAPDRGDVESVIKGLEERVKPITNELVLDSTPQGAEVFLDSRTKIAGQTPLKLSVGPGAHSLAMQQRGYEVATRDFAMPADRALAITIELRPLENVGYLIVECEQDGSQLFLDGTILAITPYLEPRPLSAGKHQVVLEHPGYARFVRTVEVHKGLATKLHARMQENEGRPSWPPAAFVVGALGIAGIAGIGFILSGALAFYAANAVSGTKLWLGTLVAAIAGTVVAGVLVLTAAAFGGGGNLVWFLLGRSGSESGQVTVAPMANPPRSTDAPPPPPASQGGAK